MDKRRIEDAKSEIAKAMSLVDLLSFVDDVSELCPGTLAKTVGWLYQCLFEAQNALNAV